MFPKGACSRLSASQLKRVKAGLVVENGMPGACLIRPRSGIIAPFEDIEGPRS